MSWWQGFGDAQLSRLIDDALQANTSVLGAQAALRQARALRDVSAAGLLPGVGATASAQRSQAQGGGTNSYRAGVDAAWEFDLFGGQRSGLDASEAGVRASEATLGDAQVSVAAEVALTYITLRSAQARLALANDNLSGQQEILQLTQWRLQAGLVTSLEAEQARSAVEQTRAQLPSLQTGIDQAGHALAVLTGRAPGALAPQLAAVVPVPQAGSDLALAFPAETLRQRPDVRAAEHRVSAAFSRVLQADAARKPSFRLSGSLGLSAAALGSLTSGGAWAAALLAGVSIPIFDGGAGSAQVRAQVAAVDEAKSAYEAAVLAALQEVEDALVVLRGDREREAHLAQAADAADQAATMARQRYASGLVDFQTVLDTQRSLRTAQDGLASAHADVSADHVRLYKALGGGWHDDNREASLTPAMPLGAAQARP